MRFAWKRRAAEPVTIGAAPEVPPKAPSPVPVPLIAETEAPGAPISGLIVPVAVARPARRARHHRLRERENVGRIERDRRGAGAEDVPGGLVDHVARDRRRSAAAEGANEKALQERSTR